MAEVNTYQLINIKVYTLSIYISANPSENNYASGKRHSNPNRFLCTL